MVLVRNNITSSILKFGVGYEAVQATSTISLEALHCDLDSLNVRVAEVLLERIIVMVSVPSNAYSHGECT